MKIAVFDDLPEGGAKRVLYEQIKGLSQRHTLYGFTNEVVSQFDVKPFVRQLTRFDLRLENHRGWARPLQELSLITALLPRYRQIVNLINALDVDVVLVHPSRLTQAPLLLSLLRQPSVYVAEEWPRIVYEPKFHTLPAGFHGVYEWCRRLGIRVIDQREARSATVIVATSKYMVEQLSTIYDRKVTWLPLGVDLNTFCPNKGVERQSFFLFFGDREAISGYPLLVQGLHNQAFAVKHVTFKHAAFRYTDADIVTMYQQAMATLCLAENEPFGLTALESMACGTPVIAVASGGHLDTVVPDQTGLLIKPNKESLVEAMRWMVDNREKRQLMGQKGRQRVEKYYSWENHVKRLEQILKEAQ